MHLEKSVLDTADFNIKLFVITSYLPILISSHDTFDAEFFISQHNINSDAPTRIPVIA